MQVKLTLAPRFVNFVLGMIMPGCGCACRGSNLPGSGVPRVRDFGARQVSDSGLAFRFKITCSHDLSIHYPGGAAGSPNYCRKDAVGTPAEPTARGSDCMHLVES